MLALKLCREKFITISNDPDDILNAVKEMIISLKDEKFYSTDLQKRYKSLLNKKIGCFYGMGKFQILFRKK